MKLSLVAFLSALATTVPSEGQGCAVPGTLTCYPISSSDTSPVVGRAITTPALDGDLSEWADVTGGIETPMRNIFGATYDMGNAIYKCLYDDEKIYL